MIRETLITLSATLKAANTGLNERNTDRAFVSPVLESIGWNLSNLSEVVADYKPMGLKQGSEISYALFAQLLPILLVDIRPLYSDLSQVLPKISATAKASPSKYLVSTNGVQWNLYNIEGNPVLKMTIDIRDNDAQDKLQLMSKESIISGLLEKYINELPVPNISVDEIVLKNRGYKVSDKTHDALNKLRIKIMTSRSVKDQEITNSMIVELLLDLFLENSPTNFSHMEISNQTILRQRIQECLRKYAAK
ncbi:MAG: hypothetical protein PHZ03_00265 [Syntrophomonas sp.]|nr:hypothetical protein [Syntrophomonas sp.]